MAYHLHDLQLRVVHRYASQARNRPALASARLILLEHLLPTTEAFVHELLGAGCEIFELIGKPYSVDPDSLSRLKQSGVNVVVKSYDDLDDTLYTDELIARAVALSKEDKKQIVIAEVGGYFAQALSRMPPDFAQFIAGVVEDTTYGHNRYCKLVRNISVPVFSVARSTLKEIEAKFVGRDAVQAMESILRNHGVTIAGRRSLVIGYGMIGSNIAPALKDHSLSVFVYDKHDYMNLRAFIDGYAINKKARLLDQVDIIFAATADRALTFKEIEECKSGVILASVGSRDTEFDVASVKEQAIDMQQVGKHLIKYRLSNSKIIYVARDGTAVNFLLPSIPIEVLDLVFSEIFLCIIMLLKRQDVYSPGEIHTLGDKHLSQVALEWLRFVNI